MACSTMTQGESMFAVISTAYAPTNRVAGYGASDAGR